MILSSPLGASVPPLPSGAGVFRRLQPRSVPGWIRLLVVACIVPSWLLAMAVAVVSNDRERSALLDFAAQHAQTWMLSIERELAIDVAVLQTLATSTLIDDREPLSFHDMAAALVQQRSAYNLLLLDRDLRPLGSLDRRARQPLPQLYNDRFPKLLDAAEPAVSDLFIGQVAEVPLLAVAVPVRRDGKGLARLEMIFSPERFRKLLLEQDIPAGWAVALLDRQGRRIADNRRADNRRTDPPAGGIRGLDPAPAAWQAALRQPRRGCSASVDDAAAATQLCLATSSRHGWTVVVEIPEVVLTAKLRHALLQGAAGTAALLLVGLVLAGTIGRGIAAPIQSLLAPAAAIGRGEPARVEPSALQEAQALGSALLQAQDLLHEREQARQWAEAHLRNSEARLRMAMEAGGVGDWELDRDTGEIRHSAAHDQCFGHSQPMADFGQSSFFDAVHPDDRVRFVERSKAAVAAGLPWREDIRVRWPDGSEHWLLSAGIGIVEGGRTRRLFGVVVNIDERKRSESLRLHSLQLELENQQILKASRLKSEFLANMSHELRTPLNAVIGFAELLQAGTPPLQSALGQEFLGHVEDGGRRLLQLINDVLDLSKFESGKFEFFPEVLDVPRLVAAAITAQQAEAARRRIAVGHEIDPALGEVLLDPMRFEQVLHNFLSNAIKYTADGGCVQLRVLAQAPDQLRIEVQDNGMGIAEADQPRLFVPFQQVHGGDARQHQGGGLGLALTRCLVEGQGGSVGLSSTPGQGSLFFAVLPRGAALPTSPPTSPPTLAGVPAAASGSPRVLVVEDEVADQSRLVQALSQAGFQVDVAATGALALELAASRLYDAVTLDLLLPDCSGLEVLARLRASEQHRDVPVVVVTMVTETAVLAGFQVDDVLIKPFRGDDLIASLRRLPRAHGAAPRIMVVDDDPMSLALMSATLRSVGLSSIEMRDGETALAGLAEHLPDAMVLDLTLPGLNGFDVLAALRSNPEFAQLPVFVWTSQTLSSSELTRLRSSAQGVVNKGLGGVDTMIGHLRQWRQRLASAGLPPTTTP